MAGELRGDGSVFELQIMESSRKLLARGYEAIEILFKRREPFFNPTDVILCRDDCDYAGEIGIGKHVAKYNMPCRSKYAGHAGHVQNFGLDAG